MQRLGRNRFIIVFVVVGLALITASAAWAQASRTIKLILPFPPGGPADTMARVLAEQIGVAGGPSMVVEGHPGAATEIGTEYVSRAAADGATLGIISNSFVVLPHFRKLNYEPLTDFVPICELASFPPLIVVNSASPYHALADLIEAARQQPGKLTLATIGPATASQLAFEALKRDAKANITFVPFNGYTPAIQALLGDQVTAALADLSTLQGQLQTGKLRALATTARQRIPLLPDVPTVGELGYKDSEAEFFGGVVAPTKTPQPTIEKLIKWFTAAMRVPDVTAKFAALGFYPGGACGADFATIIRQEYDRYGRIVRDAHLNTD
jgi:tripartite-type tricarboxylate transporter receptor subunit TctC